MNNVRTLLVAFATLFTTGLTACHSGDDDEPINNEIKDLVTANVPAEGWTGNTENGILKFSPDEYDAEDINSYFAFEMKNGVCHDAVYNIVMTTATEARQLAKMLNDGTWVDIDEDDEVDYMSANLNQARKLANRAVAFAKRASMSRATVTLPIPVRQEGRVIYIVLPNFEGVSAADLKEAVNLWSGHVYDVPQRVVFGKYENGTYTCHNMHGMNITYVINTEFNSSGFCSKYVTTLTLPTESWAEFYYEAYEDQMDDFENKFGERPGVSRNGKEVRVDAVIIGDVPRADVEALIFAIDWLNNCPFLYGIF